MTSTSGDRAAAFPAIERQHGQPMAFWFERLTELDDDRYDAQMALLREGNGFSRAHANAVVMVHRGSTSSRRFAGTDAYFASLDPQLATTSRAIFTAITAAHPDLELVIAWNQPMLRWNVQPDGDHHDGRHDGRRDGRRDGRHEEHRPGYVIGVSAATRHLTINPWSTAVLEFIRPELTGYVVNKHTFQVPAAWKVDGELLERMVTARLAELGARR